MSWTQPIGLSRTYSQSLLSDEEPSDLYAQALQRIADLEARFDEVQKSQVTQASGLFETIASVSQANEKLYAQGCALDLENQRLCQQNGAQQKTNGVLVERWKELGEQNKTLTQANTELTHQNIELHQANEKLNTESLALQGHIDALTRANGTQANKIQTMSAVLTSLHTQLRQQKTQIQQQARLVSEQHVALQHYQYSPEIHGILSTLQGHNDHLNGK